MNPTVRDVPNRPALADAIAELRRGTEIRLGALEDGRVSVKTGLAVATIVRAVLARPDTAVVEDARVEPGQPGKTAGERAGLIGRGAFQLSDGASPVATGDVPTDNDEPRESAAYFREVARKEADAKTGAMVAADTWAVRCRNAEADLAETRDRRDYLQGQLDIIYDAEYSRNDALLRRIEKLMAAGDTLYRRLSSITPQLWVKTRDADLDAALAELHVWESVRGDTPTDGFGSTDTVSAPPKPTQSAGPADSDGLHRALADITNARNVAEQAGDGHVREGLDLALEIVQGEIAAPTDDDSAPDAPLTAEQYRHIYDDLIHGLAVDLGLDPELAGGGSVSSAVRRLVAGSVSVPQKPAQNTEGNR